MKKVHFWQAACVALVLMFALYAVDNWPRSQAQQAGQSVVFASLNAVTSGTGNVWAVNNASQVGWSVIWSSNVTGGEVVIEAADTRDYAGTWAELDRQNFTAAPAANSAMTGTYPGPLQFMRARVTSSVTGTGGHTVTVNLQKLVK